MGAVYEVEHTKLGMHYALKAFVLETGDFAELFQKRFQAEGRILARLQHPNIVRVFDLNVDPNTRTVYYVMNLVLYKDGEAYSLDDLEQGGADEEHIVAWFRQLCDALSYVHSNGIVHRDIKPANILIAPGRHVVISDFGISKVHDEKLRTDIEVSKTYATGEQVKFVMGTAGYMAPEILEGEECTPSSDVYSLGVVFFRLLTGVKYERYLATGQNNALKLLDYFEYNWKDILPKMLAEDPKDRPQDLKALAGELVSNSGAKEPSQEAASTAARLKKRIFLVALFVCSALAIAAGVVYVSKWYRSDVEEDMLTDAFAIPESLK
jgi:serine/threonine protein kinase